MINFKGLETVVNRFFHTNWRMILEKGQDDHPVEAVNESRKVYYDYIEKYNVIPLIANGLTFRVGVNEVDTFILSFIFPLRMYPNHGHECYASVSHIMLVSMCLVIMKSGNHENTRLNGNDGQIFQLLCSRKPLYA
jgi:hypothetical protein